MRILHAIFSTEYAGSEAYCCQLASLQARAGDDVLVLARRGDPAYVARLARDVAPARLQLLPRGCPGLLEGLAARRPVQAFRPDIVHTHLGRATERLNALARRLGVPHVATLHIEWRRPYAACDGVICVAGWQRRAIPASYAGEVAVIWNWIRDARAEATAAGARTGPLTVLSVGRLVPNKGMDVLIQAFHAAFPDQADVRLVIAGSGPDGERLRALAAGDPRIAFPGFVEAVAPLYAAADIYVSAARFEPFGLTILEAMQAGCRLVATRTEGPSDYLATQRGVVWAAPGDVASLAEALRTAAAAPRARQAWDLQPFSAAVAVSRIRDVYTRLLAARRR